MLRVMLAAASSGGGDPDPGGGDIPTTGLLAAYSVRKLIAAYAGSAIRVRRSSDNAEQDIGFDGSGDLDTAALAAFLGAATGHVTTWYDQSGHGQHATQATAARQPVILSAEVSGLPGIGFQDGGTVRALTLPAVGTTRTWVTVSQFDYATFTDAFNAGAFSVRTGLMSQGGASLALSSGNSWLSPPWDITYNDGVQESNKVTTPADWTTPHVVVWTAAAGIDMSSGQLGSDLLRNDRSWEGEICEVLLYDAVLSTSDRQAAEASALAYYGIA